MKRTGDKGRADLAEQIVDLVAPPQHRKAECAKQIEVDVALVQRVAKDSAALPTSKKKIRRDVDRLALTLKKARAIARQLPAPVLPHTLFNEHFAAQLETVIGAAECFARDIVVAPGKQPWDGVKYVSKLRAHHLLKDFSSSASRGFESRKEEIGSLLFEIVTGQEGADLSDYRINDDTRLDRIEPSLILRRKFVAD